MRKISIAAGIILLCLSVLSCSQPGFIDNQLSDEVYGYYFAAETDEKAPGILLLMGGSGYKKDYDEIAKALAGHGYAVLIVDHYGGGDDWGGNGINSDETIKRYNQNAEAGLTYLLSREEVDRDRIGIIGFS